MKARFQALSDKLVDIAGIAMLEHKEPITQLLVNQHTTEYIDSEGNPLRTHIKKFVFDFSTETDAPFRLDKKENAGVSEHLVLQIEERKYIISSPATTQDGNLKQDWLEHWNEAEIMKLAPQNVEQVFPIIKDTFIELCREEINS